MSLDSLRYFLFLPIVLLVCRSTRDRWRWLVLLLASLAFYASLNAPYLLVALVATTAVTYVLGIRMESAGSGFRKAVFLWGGIAVNLLVLIFMKCLPSLARFGLLPAEGIGKRLFSSPDGDLASVGVSFFTIQAISYLVDIYLGVSPAQVRPGRFALYLGFFPKLLQGPIERGRDLLPQLASPYVFTYDGMRMGLVMIAGGLFKKMVLADRLAQYVNPVYNNVHDYSGMVFLVATYLYAFQIYFDFSGYTDIALGSARLFGIRLTENFRSPYTATSIADFWRRWHISFSRWLLDYIFMPLQIRFRRMGDTGTALALIVTFLASGAWHGFGWSFLMWGLLHGLFLAASVYYRPYQKSVHEKLGVRGGLAGRTLQRFVTFHLVCLAWIFFRANSLPDALYIVTHMFAGTGKIGRLLTSQERFELWFTVLSLGLMAYIHHLGSRRDNREYLFSRPPLTRWSFYYAIVLSILLFGKYFSAQTFIYGKF
jgi:alginate O-acetyltransferase complex protein AlgI